MMNRTIRAMQRVRNLCDTLNFFSEAPKIDDDINSIEDFIANCEYLDVGVYEYKQARDVIQAELSDLNRHLDYLFACNENKVSDFTPEKISINKASDIFKEAVPYFVTDFNGQVHP